MHPNILGTNQSAGHMLFSCLRVTSFPACSGHGESFSVMHNLAAVYLNLCRHFKTIKQLNSDHSIAATADKTFLAASCLLQAFHADATSRNSVHIPPLPCSKNMHSMFKLVCKQR